MRPHHLQDILRLIVILCRWSNDNLLSRQRHARISHPMYRCLWLNGWSNATRVILLLFRLVFMKLSSISTVTNNSRNACSRIFLDGLLLRVGTEIKDGSLYSALIWHRFLYWKDNSIKSNFILSGCFCMSAWFAWVKLIVQRNISDI